MNRKEAIEQLKDLIDDRRSFIDKDTEEDSFYHKDIEALNIAITALEAQEGPEEARG